MNAQCVDADVVLPRIACVKNTVYIAIRSLVPGNKSCSLKPIDVSLEVHATAQMWPELNGWFWMHMSYFFVLSQSWKGCYRFKQQCPLCRFGMNASSCTYTTTQTVLDGDIILMPLCQLRRSRQSQAYMQGRETWQKPERGLEPREDRKKDKVRQRWQGSRVKLVPCRIVKWQHLQQWQCPVSEQLWKQYACHLWKTLPIWSICGRRSGCKVGKVGKN